MSDCPTDRRQRRGRYLELLDFTLCIDFDHLTQVSSGDGRGHNSDGAHLGGEIRCKCIDNTGEFLPCSLYTFHEGLSAKFARIVKFVSDA